MVKCRLGIVLWNESDLNDALKQMEVYDEKDTYTI